MPSWESIAIGAYAVVVAAAAFRHFVFQRTYRKLTFLQKDGPKVEANHPFVSILVPAKDEEGVIEDCVRSLLAQDYPAFEVLVIDDRSVDKTASIVEKLAASDRRLRLIRIGELPPGWTGKTHALYTGQKQARGEWLLFVDADTLYDPSCLGVVLRDAIDHGADLESLIPALDCRTFWERVIQPFAGICLMVFFPIDKVNDPKRKSFGFANGQFIMIRRQAYDAIGGHEAVRDKFVEDIHLGRNARSKDLGVRVVMGREVSCVRMYASLASMMRGWSRILYSAVDFRPARLYLLFFSICIFSVLSYAMLIGTGLMLVMGSSSPTVVTLFWLAVLHELFQTTLMARVYLLSAGELRYLALRFLAVFIMLAIIARTIRMCSTHAVTWRGTSYGKEIQQAAQG